MTQLTYLPQVTGNLWSVIEDGNEIGTVARVKDGFIFRPDPGMELNADETNDITRFLDRLCSSK